MEYKRCTITHTKNKERPHISETFMVPHFGPTETNALTVGAIPDIVSAGECRDGHLVVFPKTTAISQKEGYRNQNDDNKRDC